MNKQPFQKGKEIYAKIVAAIAAFAVTATGGVCAALFSNNKSDEQIVPDVEITTDVEEDTKLLLSSDFSINKSEEVRKRAEAIYEISEQTISVNEIIDMIYLTNGASDKIAFSEGTSDTDKFKYIQSLIVNYTNLFNDNIRDDVNARANSIAGEEVSIDTDEEIYSYMLISKENKKAKNMAIKMARIIHEQLENIKNSDVELYEEVSNRFYSLFRDIKDSDYSDGIMLTMITEIQQHAGLFSLTNEMSDEIYQNQAAYSNNTGFDVVEKHDINMDKVIEDAEKDGFGNKVTPNGSKYNKEDAKDAEKYVSSGTKEEPTKIIDNGGEEIGTTQSVISGGEILNTEKHTETVNVETTTKIVTEEKGGEIIGTEIYTEIVKVPDEIEIVDGIGEIVEQGGVPVTYSDSDVKVETYSLK